MGNIRQLLIVEAVGLTALVLVAGLMAAYFAVESAMRPSYMFTPASAAWVVFAYTCFLGVVPVALLGAPGYWFLLCAGLARWHWALLLGVAPGLAFLAVDVQMAWWAAACGSAVALATHTMCRRLGVDHGPKPARPHPLSDKDASA